MRTLSAARWVAVVLLSTILLAPAFWVHFGARTIVEVTGSSMAPTLHVGDVALIRPMVADTVRPGDIVTVDDGDGGYVTHRVLSLSDDGALQLKGDANLFADADTHSPAQVLGVLDGVLPMPWGTAVIQLQQWPLRISLLVTILGLAFLPLKRNDGSSPREARVEVPTSVPVPEVAR